MLDMTKITPAPWYAHNPDDRYFMNVYCVTNSPDEPDTESEDTTGVICGTLVQTPMTFGQWHERWEADAEFIALARNALDTAMRRRWGVTAPPMCFVIPAEDDPTDFKAWCESNYADDPLSAWIEADRWYASHHDVAAPVASEYATRDEPA